ncbi:venom serine protease [Aedes aegypti]|uniref:Uncharacterized protein n=1 Tax=Aedes aegypti TaxID=7159 RepID=A0A6I8TG83_AEDAE|nr:venom serine protease [Aedes aegypti]
METHKVWWMLVIFALIEVRQAIDPVTSPGENTTPKTGGYIPALGLLSLVYADPPIQQPPNKCADCLCGRTNSGRIVSGSETTVNKYPWMAAIVDGAKQICGGALITDRHVVTAAHCIVNNPELLKVVLLAHDWSKNEPQRIISRLEWVAKHPEYKIDKYYIKFDVAVLKLATVLEMNDKLRPICMPDPAVPDKTYDVGTALGWGKTIEDGSLSKTLREVDLNILTNTDCKTKYYSPNLITDDMVCAYAVNKGVCTGDGGGPLQIKNKEIKSPDVYQLLGLASWGDGCARNNKPGVFSKITPVLSWIKSITTDGCYCRMKEATGGMVAVGKT